MWKKNTPTTPVVPSPISSSWLFESWTRSFAIWCSTSIWPNIVAPSFVTVISPSADIRILSKPVINREYNDKIQKWWWSTNLEDPRMFGWCWQRSEQQVYVTRDRLRAFRQPIFCKTNLDRLYTMRPCFLPLFPKDDERSPILKKNQLGFQR